MTKWVGVAAIGVVALGIVGYKVVSRDRGGPSAAAATTAKTDKAPRVLLFADLREAEDSCGCGRIIRAVRDAGERGVPIRENDEALGREHRVTIEPTVIILDGSGRESARHEGESEDTISALRKDLDALPVDKG